MKELYTYYDMVLRLRTLSGFYGTYEDMERYEARYESLCLNVLPAVNSYCIKYGLFDTSDCGKCLVMFAKEYIFFDRIDRPEHILNVYFIEDKDMFTPNCDLAISCEVTDEKAQDFIQLNNKVVKRLLIEREELDKRARLAILNDDDLIEF